MGNNSLFNGTSKYAGYMEAFRGGKAEIQVYRKSASGEGARTKIGEGFMVSGYNAQFQRDVTLNYFLNIEDAVALIGRGTGTLSLQGMIGRLEDFDNLLGNTDAGEDICNMLVVEITGATNFQKCTTDASGATTTSSGSGTIICAGGIITGVTLAGQVQQNGQTLQQGSLAIKFTEMKLSRGDKSASDTSRLTDTPRVSTSEMQA